MSLSTIDSRSLRKSMASRREPSSRRLTLSTLALAATILSIVTVAFSALTAASLASLSFRALAIISVLLNIAALAALVLFLIQVVWRGDERWYSSAKSRTVLLSLYSVPLFLASLLTVVTYGLTQSHIDHVRAKDSGASSDFMAAKFAVWALSTLTQAIFIVAATRWLPLASDASLSRSPTEIHGQEMRDRAPPMMLDLKGENPGGDLASPTFSTDTLSRDSWRSSLQQVVRPITSRTRLLSMTSSLRKSGSFYSGNTTRTNSIAPSDGFESWDTSSVDQQARDIATQSADIQQDMLRVLGPGRGGTRLDTIPGSRPVSPARALDGPFPPSPSPNGPPVLELNLDDLPAPAPAFMAGSPHSSRPSTPTSMTTITGVDDANVHPLFRSDSPHPPPAASPGTVVVASPFSGQVIARPSRSRANSRTRGAASAAGTYGTYDGHSIRSNASMRSLRSPSPPAREITPPVPDFIFSNGDSPRVSSASLRKVNLHKEGEN
ncbi:uv excision repair protein [Diplodia corticola]|uniref:Uv excision repair protein n=1 Tax=Diplodia corticola TaxID=236234 RepID=A0A1J9R8H4_9PEZI|nr:uv excision repair protein [Diplodia corticola]OJD28699.1 uv excision repair protein [Diplodia corticola]